MMIITAISVIEEVKMSKYERLTLKNIPQGRHKSTLLPVVCFICFIHHLEGDRVQAVDYH